MGGQPRKALLIDTAFKLFNELGYHAAGIDLILRESGVSKATLYKHFRSKDELILAVLRQRHEQIILMLRETLMRSEDETVRVLAVFDTLDAWFQSNDFYGCYFIKASAEYTFSGEAIHDYAAWHKESVKHLLKEFIPDRSPTKRDSLAESLLLIMDGAIVGAHMRGDRRAAEKGKEIAAALLAQ
ncbi:TetR/AcrR family transcriptional regulator [Teredinibacter purpureus]|uniref:TetR/AcrR family transcriptional regulator n=1 Tax=Teredinibacter purpureus TaxID=2731756 RepID=UPI0005F854F3|nr:TetR/AcrR family transcriptional regulator [Teredinibacter purpureus]